MGSKVNIKSILSGFFAGFSFRQKVEHDPKGDLHVIQMKDLEHSYSSIGMNLTKIKSDKISKRAFLKKGDVLLITKGANNYAVEYKHDFEKAVAASAFYVLRPNQNKVNPSYLAWYINQPPVQQYFKANMAGTYIPNLNKGTIEEIEIELPEKNIQELISKIDLLQKREYLLSNELLARREQYISTTLLSLVNKKKYMTEKEKKEIQSRAKKVRDKTNDLTNKGANVTIDVLDMVDQLEAEIRDEIAKGALSGIELLRMVDKRAIEIERILKNYE